MSPSGICYDQKHEPEHGPDHKHDPTISIRPSLTPSTISLSSPDLGSTSITLTLELHLHHSSTPITVYTGDCLLSSLAQSFYQSDYRLYSLETKLPCDANITHMYRLDTIPIPDPEQQLLELVPCCQNAAPTNNPSTTAFHLDNDEHAHADAPSPSLPVRLKVSVGIHQAVRPHIPAEEKNTLSNFSICATPLSKLRPDTKYAIRRARVTDRHIWWWNRATKREVIEGANRRGPRGLVGPVAVPGRAEGEMIYGVKRMGWSGEVVRVEMVDYDDGDGGGGGEGEEAAVLSVLP
ncbi:hypothetical protein P7C71_g299, partial [Lecanoromycetidae sp. Uapishka_2]